MINACTSCLVARMIKEWPDPTNGSQVEVSRSTDTVDLFIHGHVLIEQCTEVPGRLAAMNGRLPDSESLWHKSRVGRVRAKHHQFGFAIIQYKHAAPHPCSYTQDSTLHRTDGVSGRTPRKHKFKIQLSVIRKQVKLQSQRPEKLPQRRRVYSEQQGAQNRPLRHTTHKSPAG